MAHPRTAAVIAQLDKSFDASVDRLADWLRIPSVSTDPQYKADCKRAADWLVADLKSLGFDARARPTPGHPVVFAHHPGPKNYAGPHILFYGHYDVQPPDPLELWESGPFEPVIKTGPRGKRIVARGAVDDKGQVMTFVEALRAWKSGAGEIPCRITMLIEGEEESSSVNLERFLKDTRDELVGAAACSSGGPCDLVLVSDTGMWDESTPAITTSLRGLTYTEVILHGPSHDLHSGGYGGAVYNPINELTEILGTLHDRDRRVTIPGFYDKVRPIDPALRAQWRGLGFDDAEFLKEVGLDRTVGETGYSILERICARPTCDINGIRGGYIGVGAKTVIGSSCAAKVSFRLVPDQEPAEIRDLFRAWLEARIPAGCRWEFLDHGMGKPYVVDESNPYLPAAAAALREAAGKDPVYIGTGGSIPVVQTFKSVLGLDTLLVGFGLEDDRVHSPNEKFELKCFALGQKSHATLLARFAEMKK